MSIIFAKDGVGWIIDHEEIIKNIYTSVASENLHHDNFPCKSFALDENLFKIVTPFLCTQEAKNVSVNGVKLKKKRKQTEISLPLQGNYEEVIVDYPNLVYVILKLIYY